MKYNPKDAAGKVLPAGDYPASIYAVTSTDSEGRQLVSKKGEDKERVTFEVYHDGGVKYVNQDFTAVSMLFMYRKLAKAIGQDEAFKAATFEATNHIGTNLVLSIEVEESDQYGDQNRIKAFKPATGTTAKPTFVAPGAVRQVVAPKPRPVDNLATAREMDPSEIPFNAGCHLFA